jgi:hypothetical protein
MHQGAFHTLGDSSDPKSADCVQVLSWEQQVLLLGSSSLIRMAGQEDIDASLNYPAFMAKHDGWISVLSSEFDLICVGPG